MKKKPLLEDMMNSLSYLYKKKLIEKDQITEILDIEYDVHYIDIKEDKIICHQNFGGAYIQTTTTI